MNPEVLLSYGKWRLVKAYNQADVRPYIALTDGYHVDYPLLHESSSVAVYDYPHKIPNGLKVRVSDVLVRMRKRNLYPFR